MREQRLWTWHLLAGIVILAGLGLHMAIMHLDGLLGIFNPQDPHPIAWANVVARAKMGFFTISYIVLLGAALFHGLYGLRNILCELGLNSGARKGLNLVLTAGGLAMFVAGTWAAWAAGALARTL